MRVLLLSFELPYPADSGGTIKTSAILTYLRRRHDVHVICFRRQPLTDEQIRWCAASGSVETVHLNRGRNVLNLARSYATGVPLSIERNRSGGMAALVSQRLRHEPYDALFVDGWMMAQYLPSAFAGLSILHEHNAEHVMWRRQADRERNPLLRFLIGLEYWRVRRYEATVLPRFDAVFAVSEVDRQALARVGPKPKRLHVLPNLPDPSLLERDDLSLAAADSAILYFGTLSWPPNVEGLKYLLESVFPLVRERHPDVRLLVAGRGAPSRLERLARRTPGVQFLGPITDAEPLYLRARLFVEASRSGGGTRLKVLNALARGLPVVASPEGAEGLDVVPGEHLLVAADARSMSEAISRLLTDDALWRSLSGNGRALIRSRYVAEAAFQSLDEVLSGAGAKA